MIRQPGGTLLALVTLAIGVGATTAVFSVVQGVLLAPLPYVDGDRLVQLWERPPGFGRSGISTLNYLDWRAQSTVFDSLVAHVTEPVTLSGGPLPIELPRRRVSSGYFDLFGTSAALGRRFTADDERPGRDRVAMVSHALWTSQFGADPAVIGRTIRLDGEAFTVIGVLPAGTAFDRTFAQLWTPLTFQAKDMVRDFYWLEVFGKLRRGVSVDRARAEMDSIGARLARVYPTSNTGWGVVVEPYADAIVGSRVRVSLYVLMAAVGMVLLTGCANLANVALVRGLVRRREIGIRVALGASPSRIVRLLLTEHLLTALCGGLLGAGMAYASVAAWRAVLPLDVVPAEAVIAVDRRALLVACVISVLSGVAFGLTPALAAIRASVVDALKETGGQGASAGRVQRRVRAALIVAELALAFVLLTSAGLLIRSFLHMQRVDTGFETTNVLTAVLPLPPSRLADPELPAYLRRIETRVAAVPGVRDVALTMDLPLSGLGWGLPCEVQGRPGVDRNTQFCSVKPVSPSYFDTLGLRLRRGRVLDAIDRRGAPLVGVINETMARRYFGADDPIGQRVLIPRVVPGQRAFGPDLAWEVIGVIADERLTDFSDRREYAAIYVTTDQGPPPYFGQGLVVRTAVDPARLQESVRGAVLEVNTDQAVRDLRPLEALKAASMASDRLRSLVLTVFAAMALALAAIGTYGVVSHAIAQRTHEIGIRAVLGATRSELVALVLRSGLLMTGLGLFAGIVASIAVSRFLSTLLFEIAPYDPLTLIASTIVLSAVAMVACYVPARRAASIDPRVLVRGM